MSSKEKGKTYLAWRADLFRKVLTLREESMTKLGEMTNVSRGYFRRIQKDDDKPRITPVVLDKMFTGLKDQFLIVLKKELNDPNLCLEKKYKELSKKAGKKIQEIVHTTEYSEDLFEEYYMKKEMSGSIFLRLLYWDTTEETPEDPFALHLIHKGPREVEPLNSIQAPVENSMEAPEIPAISTQSEPKKNPIVSISVDPDILQGLLKLQGHSSPLVEIKSERLSVDHIRAFTAEELLTLQPDFDNLRMFDGDFSDNEIKLALLVCDILNHFMNRLARMKNTKRKREIAKLFSKRLDHYFALLDMLPYPEIGNAVDVLKGRQKSLKLFDK